MITFTAEERQPWKHRYGNSPRMFLFIRGPKETQWSKLNSTSYDTTEAKKEQARLEMQKIWSSWQRLGWFPDHEALITTLYDYDN